MFINTKIEALYGLTLTQGLILNIVMMTDPNSNPKAKTHFSFIN